MSDTRATTLRTLFEILVVLAVLAGVALLIQFALPQLWGSWEGVGLLGGLADCAMLSVLAGPLVVWRLRVADRRAVVSHGRSEARPMAGMLPWAVLGIGVAASVALSARLNASRRELTEAHFDRSAEGVVSRVERTMLVPLYGLRGTTGLFKASKSVERAEFADYVAARSLRTEFPGVIGFGFVERIAAGDAESFVKAQRADGAPAFDLIEPGSGDELFVLKFFEPEGACGVDLGRDIREIPSWRAAAERAMLTGEPRAAGLGSYDDAEAGVLPIFHPVYRNGTEPATPEERRRDLSGWIVAPLRLADALAGATETGPLDLEVYQGDLSLAPMMLFDEDGTAHPDTDESDWKHAERRSFCSTHAINVAGQRWTLWIASTPEWDHENRFPAANLHLAAGLFVSVLGALLTWTLITGRVRAEELAAEMSEQSRTRELEARELLAELGSYQRALEDTVSIAVTDTGGRITLANKKFCEISGYTEGELVGQDHRILRSGYHPKSFFTELWRRLGAGETWRGEVCNRAKDGRLFWVDTTSGPIRGPDGAVRGFLCARVDITERKAAEERLRRAAFTDGLTGLPNRAAFEQRLAIGIDRRGGASGGGDLAVLFLDLDRFKQINDTMGHGVGDALLREAAGRLTLLGEELATPERPDPFYAARMGGDEFVVLLEGALIAEAARACAARLVDLMTEPFVVEGQEVVLTTSVGVALGGPLIHYADELLRHADIAMYEAKVAGKNRYAWFEPAMADRLTARAAVENDLRRAVGAGQFVLEYQPIVSLETRRVAGFEALIRWEHPEHGRIRPDEFIPAAERMGLILPIGAWVLETACRQFMAWRAELGSLAPDHISVNLSRVQLVQPDLPEVIAEILRRTGVPPSCLHLEITESAVMEDIASGTRMLHAIGALGVRQSLDDFGTGHSSLAALHDFPVQVLKIDRAFIANIDRGRRFVALVHAAADLASNLGMQVVAEGVETAGQVAVLQSLGCEFGQGYHFARPLPAAEVVAFLRSWSGDGGLSRAA